jgi:hypothetical protein
MTLEIYTRGEIPVYLHNSQKETEYGKNTL